MDEDLIGAIEEQAMFENENENAADKFDNGQGVDDESSGAQDGKSTPEVRPTIK